MQEQKRAKRSLLTGTVVSDKMNKTRVVRVLRVFKHPLYEKIVRSYKKYYAHDELGQSKIGDTVEIMSTRPLSKLKRWRVYRVVTKNK
ncbi:MAG TPA: 30S ribosomal protein S17 [Elusimicrobiales bacterium]|jgi:small subunit ribosomal protein S17|nr:30S ribosomal protein S17 [Elusimicrobiales bacterium]HOL61868.1 30S ribosomal protein S17 [Elusimicrobiales bacterium]HPO95086.1 30S ribosomal protein S17 [Elusimicrobiales bacterium]